MFITIYKNARMKYEYKLTFSGRRNNSQKVMKQSGIRTSVGFAYDKLTVIMSQYEFGI